MDLKERVFKALEDGQIREEFLERWSPGTDAFGVMHMAFNSVESCGGYSIENLRTNDFADEFADILSYLPSRVLLDLGREYLFMAWAGASLVREKHIGAVSQEFGLPGDVLESARERINDWAERDGRGVDRFGEVTVPFARMFVGIGAFVESYDLHKLIVDNRVSPIKESKLGKYSLLPMFPIMNNYRGHGWKDKEVDGKNYRVYLDAPFGLALLFNGHPNAVVAGVPADDNSFDMNQIQMVKPYILVDKDNGMDKPVYQGAARGLNGLGSWSGLMVTLAEDMARHFGFKELRIQLGKNNPWAKTAYRQDGSLHMTEERAIEVYDDTARELGYGLRRVEAQFTPGYKPGVEHWFKRL